MTPQGTKTDVASSTNMDDFTVHDTDLAQSQA